MLLIIKPPHEVIYTKCLIHNNIARHKTISKDQISKFHQCQLQLHLCKYSSLSLHIQSNDLSLMLFYSYQERSSIKSNYSESQFWHVPLKCLLSESITLNCMGMKAWACPSYTFSPYAFLYFISFYLIRY